ncbi:rifin PIR protein, putative [Plasmodium reichenowi]|uniref:Rifin PIR protein, putative n=1 Tax=Plasmodium reichenowi TaxID=5854 RepID=A0A2P9DHC9_PLARE|nr:rifin PIR protein, putative [Plasmodium reichenowi]
MKVHYINILLFSLPLDILDHSKNKSYTTPHHTPKIPTTRLLCECELYSLANYNNDPQMKKVMQQFENRTSQRFKEYDNRMKTTRQKYKDKCDKEIQKIILKDKLEKQMEQKLTKLETKIDINDIPTCVCEKSLADKTEKICLNCGMNVGGGVTLSSGVLGGISQALISAWKPAAITAAKEAAEKAATALATKAGMKAVKLKIEAINTACRTDQGFVNLISIVKESTYNNGEALVEAAKKLIGDAYKLDGGRTTSFYNTVIGMGKGDFYIGDFGEIGKAAHDTNLASETTALTKAKVGAVNTGFESSISSINAAIIAIVIIVLIMVIIYKILRYRRKKKMKKKLQYIKLLEE